MWAISNETRFKAERTFVRDRDGAEIWIVAVRATFDIDAAGELTPAEEQQDICQAPAYSGEPGISSLRYDGDLVRTKSGTDVVLHGTAHAPRSGPVPSVDVAMQVGPISKKLRVLGNRTWKKGLLGLSPGQPEPFTTMPICYERALGGPLSAEPDAPRDPSNTAGIGRVALEGAPVPNCEYPDQPVRSPTSTARVAGLGPIPCAWQPRIAFAGTYDEAWMKERQPLVPADFSDEYFRCAPMDQRVDGFLKGGEEVVLENLTPEGRLSFRLPRIALGYSTDIDGGFTHHTDQLHTVIIEPDERRLIMVWQSSLPCHHTLYTLKGTSIIEKRRLSAGEHRESAPHAAWRT